jgi:adenosylmethionine-8-amino-7-oxononanoate aminotransferase
VKEEMVFLNTSSTHLEEVDKTYVWHPFTQQQDWEREEQIVIERAEGCYLIDTGGKRYLDGVSSLWVNVHGHCRPEINKAIQAQLERVAHTTFLGLTHPSAIELAKRLIQIAPGQLQRVFYSDTGAAAMEIAIKMALQYWQQCPLPQPGRTKFFSLHSSYHGDTVGAMSVGGIDIYRKAYNPLLFSRISAPIADSDHSQQDKTHPATGMTSLEEIERTISAHAHELAAVIMEPLVQGAAGIQVYPPGYTRAIWEIAKRHQILFIVDEVATGFGKTGRMFACEHEDIEPDIMAVGKGITGGYLPLAATFATEEIYQAFLGPAEAGHTFYHGHTYTGNPLACAAAIASLDLFEQDQTLAALQPKIAYLKQRLEHFAHLPLVGSIRQCGFMVGIELVSNKQSGTPFPAEVMVAKRVIKEARRKGLIIRPLSDVLVLMPPLAISQEDLSTLLDITYEAICVVSEELI